MRTLLVLTRQESLADAIRAVLDPARYQVIAKEDVWEAESLIARGVTDASIVDVELTDVRAIRIIEEIKNLAPTAPMIVYAGSKQWEYEEDAYLLGVAHVLAKPVRGKLLNVLLERAFKMHEPRFAALEPLPSRELAPQRTPFPDHVRALEALRKFSHILTHSLHSEALLKQFLLLLREVIGVNRAIIFLRKPAALLSECAHSQDDRWLRSACAIGIEASFLDHFALSLGAGIGGTLRRQGRILKARSPEAQSNREIIKEFQLLGAEVAIPILDRESLIGVAVFDERLTGEPYENEELALIFHMLEEVGLAIRNSWLHDQLLGNHAMIADILGQLDSGCLVVGANLAILHLNPTAERIFLSEHPGKSKLEFADLPQGLGSKVFTVIKTGVALQPFQHRLAGLPGAIYQVAIAPFRTQNAATTNAALLLIEDITEREKNRQLELEAAQLRLVNSMAEHLAHEIGNSLVPLSTHQQLLQESIDDPEFRVSLSEAMSSTVRRITRLANQMVFLAREKTDFNDSIRVSDLIVEAMHDAHSYLFGKVPAPGLDTESQVFEVLGDHKALRHAFGEILLNALQANPKEPNVSVKMQERPGGGGKCLSVEVRDTGAGFTSEAAGKAQEPFFSTRNVGLGLGLTVTRKIVESHDGTVEIQAAKKGEAGLVRISLPLPPPGAKP